MNVVSDSAFPCSAELRGRILTPLNDGDLERAQPSLGSSARTLHNAITSVRQAAERGMGSMQKVYSRLSLPLPYDQKIRGLGLNNLFLMANYRVHTGVKRVVIMDNNGRLQRAVPEMQRYNLYFLPLWASSTIRASSARDLHPTWPSPILPESTDEKHQLLRARASLILIASSSLFHLQLLLPTTFFSFILFGVVARFTGCNFVATTLVFFGASRA
ncbi:hypothetical protein DVH05_005124 [Phytophthora capsici]|nr:hypothetical protein DVH05_005124 [Phytophthora capsici]